MHTVASIREARSNLAELINRVAYRGERVPLRRRGKTVAVLVSAEDAELLERLEDEADLRDAREALAEYERTGEATTLEDLASDLGIDLQAFRHELQRPPDSRSRETA
jgi:prevent-host-death family protein